MKCIKNDVLTCYCTDSSSLYSSIEKLSGLFRKNPALLEPVRQVSREIEDHFTAVGLRIYATVKKTTLIFDPESDCFFKIIQPLSLKHRLQFSFRDRSKKIYETAEYLYAKGVPLQRVEAYGSLKQGTRPFFVMMRAEGESLYDIFIRKKQTMSIDQCSGVIGEIAKIHALGFWLGDAHLSHIFVKEGRVSGIIDLDSIRRNMPCMMKNYAKDLAGLNHPHLPLSADDKKTLLAYYLERSSLRKTDKFVRLLQYYTERRWKD